MGELIAGLSIRHTTKSSPSHEPEIHAPKRDLSWQLGYIFAWAPGAALLSILLNVAAWPLGVFSDSSSRIIDLHTPPILGFVFSTALGTGIALFGAQQHMMSDSWVSYGAERCLALGTNGAPASVWPPKVSILRLRHHRIQLAKFLRYRLGSACEDFMLHNLAGEKTIPKEWRQINLGQLLDSISLQLSDETILGKTENIAEYIRQLKESLANLEDLRAFLLKTFKGVPEGFVARAMSRGKTGPFAGLKKNRVVTTILAATMGSFVSSLIPVLLRLLGGS